MLRLLQGKEIIPFKYTIKQIADINMLPIKKVT